MLSCEGQARAGHEVHLAFGPIYGPEGSLLQRVEKFNASVGAVSSALSNAFAGQGIAAAQVGGVRPISLHTLPHMVREVHPVKDHVCFHHELRPLIRKLQPDIVHTHSSKAGILGRWAAWKEDGNARRCTVVHTIHGPPFMPVEGGAIQRAKTRATNYAYTLAERFAARRCHAIVSVADAMTNEFLRRGIGDASQYVTVRSGMEVEPFLHTALGTGQDRASVRTALGLSDSDFVIGTVARLAQHKGHDDLLDALAEDLKRNPHWRLLWVGDGWWRDRLVNKAQSMGLGVREVGEQRAESAAQVLLTGLVPPERIPAMIRAMDVLAHPSYREGLPRTVPQALLCGVCPVAYDVDGTGEACRDMQTGRLVPPGNIAALRDAIRWCAEHPAERAALAARGREECRTVFSAQEMVRRLEEVYTKALQRTL